MKYGRFCLAFLALFLLSAGICRAHRVNVFAFADGDAIQVECGFSRTQKVRNGKLIITDLETGATLLEGGSDEQGMFRFRPADSFLMTGRGLNIHLVAGEGHENDWQVSPEELRALTGFPSAAGAALTETARSGEHTDGPPQPAPSAKAGRISSPGSIDAAEMEAIVSRVLDAKLAPLKQALARQEERGPGLRDIVGGIGWILGLLGLAAYIKYKP